MADWLKDIQSIGRGIRNGELNVIVASRQSGKSVILDYESQGIEPTFQSGLYRNWSYQHWCHNSQTGKWTYHKTRPFHEHIQISDKIIVRDSNGIFHWYKDRESGKNRELTEEELKSLTFVFIGAEEVVPEWTDILAAASNPGFMP